MSRLNGPNISQNIFSTSLDTIDLLVPRSSRFIQGGNGLYAQLHLKQRFTCAAHDVVSHLMGMKDGKIW